jgi:hypothetical protein
MVLVDDNTKGDFYGKKTRYIKGIGESHIQRNRMVFCTQARLEQYNNNQGSDYTLDNKNYTEKVIVAPMQFSGYCLFLCAKRKLNEYGNIHFTNGFINTTKSNKDSIIFYITFQDNELQKYYQSILKISQYQIVEVEKINVKGTTYNAKLYQNKYESSIKRNNIPYEKFIYVKNRSGEIIPAVVIKLGKLEYGYAMYGVWHNEKVASQYGYHVGQKIYFSEKQITPINESVLYGLLNRRYRHGINIWTEEEVLKDKRNIFPQLSWRPCKLWGDMAVEFNNEGAAIPYEYKGIKYEIPNNPDNINNTNPIGFQDLPDVDWYYSLFDTAYKKITSTEKKPLPASEFLDYETYMCRKISQKYDPTQYHNDGSISPVELSHNKPPKYGSIYDKNCNLLSEDPITIPDPLSPQTSYKLWYMKKNFRTLFGKKYGKFNVSNQIKIVLNNIRSIYSTVSISPKSATTYTGMTIEYINQQYADSTWYFANRLNKYRPFTNANHFIVIHQHYKNNNEWLRVESRKISNNNKNDNFTPRKKFYLLFQWPLVYKDKHGIIHQVGYANYKEKFYTENDHMHHIYGGNKKGKNKYVIVESGNNINFDFKTYDANSKEYHTDQYDISKRSRLVPEIDGDEGQIRDLITHILVAELLDFTMKQMHRLGSKRKKVALLYETCKRIENNVAVKISYKLAREAFESYMLWRESMDLCARIRDTYIEMGNAWRGLKQTTRNLISYYKGFKWEKVRLTSVSKLLPNTELFIINHAINRMHNSLFDFSVACDEMALHADSLVVSPVVRLVNSKLKESAYETTILSKQLDQTITNLEELYRNTEQQGAKQQYLSLMTNAFVTALENSSMKVINGGTLATALSLHMISKEAEDWGRFKTYMNSTFSKNGFQDFSANIQDQEKFTFYPFFKHFRAPENLFEKDLSKINNWFDLPPNSWDFVSINNSINSN